MSLPPPIKPVRVDVVGIHPQYARLLILEIELDQIPPARWVECFERAAQDMPWIDMHPPCVRGCTITLNPGDAEIEGEVAHVEERVLLANQRWLALLAADAAPEAANAQDSDMFSPDVRERIAAARARTRSMSEAFSVQGFWRSDAWVTEDLLSLEGVTRN